MKKILAAHDGSDAADRALLEAAAIAQKFGSKLTVISVVPNLCFSENRDRLRHGNQTLQGRG
ncbi:universal stress protein [Dissulfurispira sp.]|uniref:universal stress protein n=1 Tax=Dissulfurispira sp. TaxID=2817609 RepID=UPI003FA55EB9